MHEPLSPGETFINRNGAMTIHFGMTLPGSDKELFAQINGELIDRLTVYYK